MARWQDAASADAVTDDGVLAVSVGGAQLALFRIGNEVFALLDLCSHGQARLSDGYVEDGCVECPLHQGLVDIRTGAPRKQPITEPVQSYPARVRDGRIEIEI
jgi:nitrite reductase/ring-hydroxylating ferredoxin subunit